ncbi:hypothetical protein HK101_009540 [Irineochytrium annulatum]|nr:hypothetical protein HK101_009540 [Irineochytrium annulatum]
MPKSGDDQPAATKPASAWSTAQIMLNPSILLLIPFFMYYAIEKGFFSGIFPLLISTTSERSDLLTKLYLSAVWGCSDMLTSFLFGRATDYWGPEAMTWLLSGVQATAMIALWCVGPMNNLALLYPVAFLLGFCDALVVIQTFKLMQLLFPSDVDLAPAYSASWFVRAFFIGLAFVVSPATLAPGKVPRLTIWAPLIVALVVVMACGVSVAVRRRKRSQIVI